MAETIRIEIPVDVIDNTGSGTASVTRNLTSMEKAFQKAEKTAQRMQKVSGVSAEIEINADDNATPAIASVEDATSRVDGATADIQITAEDSVTQVVKAAENVVENFNGTSGDAEIGVNDSATQVIRGAEDSLLLFNNSSGIAEIGIDDNAIPVIDAADDALSRFNGEVGMAEITVDSNVAEIVYDAMGAVENFDGTSVDAEIGASDEATPVIRAAEDAAEAWAGSTYEAVIGIVDKVTAPISKMAGAAKNPIVQGASLLGISMGISDSVNSYREFSSVMSQVQAISGATGQALDNLTAKAQEMGSTTKFTATESAEAFNYMAMAGWKPQQMIDGIEGVMNLAAASGEDLATTSDIVTDALTAFGLKAGDAGHFSDVLAQASANANTNVSMLGESFKYVAPVAGAMNYSIEDTSLALGLMANASVKGSMAGTALKTSLANMAAPTKSMAAAMKNYGISLTDSEGNMKSLKGVMDNLRTSLGGLSETEQTAAASTIFGKEAMTGMLAIINASAEDYDKLTTAIYNADGASKKMADTMLDNLEGSIVLMQSAIEGTQNTLGERMSPYLRGIVDGIADAMPAVSTKINDIMDAVDEKASSIQRKFSGMTSSAEWQNADMFGKLDIAWDTLIADPFLQWAAGDGAQIMSTGLGTLFSSAAAILPGGKKAGLSSIISSMFLAKGATSIIGNARNIGNALMPIGNGLKSIVSVAKEAPSVGAFISNLGTMVPTATKFGIAAAAVTTAVVGIKMAIDSYNNTQLNNNLEEHFGKIKLSAGEIRDIASGILNQKYLTNVELALNEVRNADGLREEAQKALESNDVLEFKSRVGITLTPEEKEEYTGNIKTFVNSKIEELESRTFAAYIHVQTYLGGTEEGQSLEENIKAWARADNLELSELSNDLQTAVENALKDGIISVKEEEAISALQEKMNSITARWKEAEAQAQWDWINQKYGRLSAADLESGSFTDLMEEMRTQRETAMESVQSDVTQWYSELRAMENRPGITNEQKQQIQQAREMTGWYVKGQEGQELAKSLTLGNNTLNDVYGDLVTTNLGRIASKGGGNTIQSLNEYAATGNFGSIIQDGLLYNDRNFYSLNGGGDRKALNSLYEQMKPDVADMGYLIDSYREAGQKVPQSLMDSFNESIKIGAASGDSDAAWQLYANSIKESGNSALVSALTDPNNEWYSVLQDQLPEEFKTALQRAFSVTTDEEYTLEGIKASVDGDVDVDKDAWLSKIQESLGDLGTVEGEVDGDIQVKVEKGDCLSQIGEALGVDWHEIAAYNGIEDPYVIYTGMELKIPEENVNVDASGVSGAVENATEVDPVEAETSANVTVVPGETDTSQVEAATQEQLDGSTGSIPTEATADTTVIAGNTDTSQAQAEVTSKVENTFSETIPADGHTDVTLDQTNNAAQVYAQVASEVQSQFDTTISAEGSVSVHLNWSISNPTASITTSGSGSSVTASIAGNAEGSIVTGPLLSWVGEDGPEAIIPLGAKRRDRGMELWLQAGRALGVKEYADGGIVGNSPIPVDDNSSKNSSSGSGDKPPIVINLNPTFNLGEGDDNKTAEAIYAKMKELMNEMYAELAVRMFDTFANTPT